jgi:hypothetical protein
MVTFFFLGSLNNLLVAANEKGLEQVKYISSSLFVVAKSTV